MSQQHADAPRPDHHAMAGGEAVRLTWSGSPWRLVGLSFLNLVLTIVTLGIYSFWGKTEVRRRIWSSVRLQGEPLEYTGTGLELFLGFLLVFVTVLLPVVAVVIAAILFFGPQSPWAAAVQVALYVTFLFLIGVAIYRARRYRLSRTSWRGIRAGMAGSSFRYALMWFFSALLIPFTLGWIVPWRANRLQRRLTSETAIGNQLLGFNGGSGPMYPRFAVLWFGAIVLYLGMIGAIYALLGPKIMAQAQAAQYGVQVPFAIQDVAAFFGIIAATFVVYSIISAWYLSRQFNLFASYTAFDRAHLSSTTTALGLIGLFVSNFLIVLLSLSILRPVAMARAARYFIERLSIGGTVDLARVAQGQADRSRTGEGLAQAFDVDAF